LAEIAKLPVKRDRTPRKCLVTIRMSGRLRLKCCSRAWG
jgi:hypothetical protein